jgi:hypothetical protein
MYRSLKLAPQTLHTDSLAWSKVFLLSRLGLEDIAVVRQVVAFSSSDVTRVRYFFASFSLSL